MNLIKKFWMWEFFFVMLFPTVCLTQAQICDLQKLEALGIIITTIEEVLGQAVLNNNHYSCFSYGDHNYHGFRPRDNDDHSLNTHYVCTHPLFRSKILYVHALVEPHDAAKDVLTKKGKGTPVYDQSREWLKRHFDICKCDECGHIVPQSLGGSGLLFNLFIQENNLNRGLWSSYCSRMNAFLKENEDENSIYIKVKFIYMDDNLELRPSGFYFRFEYRTGGDVVKTDNGYLTNENHDGIVRGECVNNNGDTLLYITRLGSMLPARRSCSMVTGHETYHYGPTPDDRLTTLLTPEYRFPTK